MTPQEWVDIVEMVKASSLTDWHAYECENGAQSLSRLTRPFGRHEVQLNRLRHSEGEHCHECEMVSLILQVGYGYWLRQWPAENWRYQFAAPGSLITMAGNDAHQIPALKTPSLSLCVFDKHADWHLHYPPLAADAARAMLYDAKFALLNSVAIPELKGSR